MVTPTRLSYGVLAATIILAGLLHLALSANVQAPKKFETSKLGA
jgi:hypothetical protein